MNMKVVLNGRRETRLAKKVWAWAKKMFKRDPVDECAYRKRLIFAFTLQPILLLLWLLCKLVSRVIFTVLGTAFTLVYFIALFFLGFYEASYEILENISPMWRGRCDEVDFDLYYFRYKMGRKKRHRFAPWEIILVVGVIGAIFWLFTNAWFLNQLTLLWGLIFTFFTFLTRFWAMSLVVLIIIATIIFFMIKVLNPSRRRRVLVAREKDKEERAKKNPTKDICP